MGILLIIAAKLLSDWNKQRRVMEARAEGFAAYEQGDYESALNPLSFALANDRNDRTRTGIRRYENSEHRREREISPGFRKYLQVRADTRPRKHESS